MAAGCCLWRAATYRKERTPWLIIGLGMLSFAAAELYYTIFSCRTGLRDPLPVAGRRALPRPLPGPARAGLLLLARSRAGRLPWMLWVDGLIVALSFAAVTGALVYGKVLDATGGDPLTVATNLAYPSGRPAAARPDRGPARRVRPERGARLVGADLRLRAARCAPTPSTSTAWRVESYEVGGVLDAAWPAGMVLVGAAAWQRPRELDGKVLADRGFLPVPLAAGLCATRDCCCSTTTSASTRSRSGLPPRACSRSSSASAAPSATTGGCCARAATRPRPTP